MAKTKKKSSKIETGEQMDLIDVAPKNAKEIVAVARRYQKYQAARVGALAQEIEQKTLLLELVKKADLQELRGGKIKFEVDGIRITITPRDELVQVSDTNQAAQPKK